MIYTFIMSSFIIKELEANEISILKSLWCILKGSMKKMSKIIHMRTKTIFCIKRELILIRKRMINRKSNELHVC